MSQTKRRSARMGFEMLAIAIAITLAILFLNRYGVLGEVGVEASKVVFYTNAGAGLWMIFDSPKVSRLAHRFKERVNVATK